MVDLDRFRQYNDDHGAPAGDAVLREDGGEGKAGSTPPRENILDRSFKKSYRLSVARPREFDAGQVLDQALMVFWQRGYEACSVRDLVEATGLQRQSLYNVFHDKRRLFLAALSRYREGIEADLRPLAAEDADLDSIRRYIEGALAAQHEYGSGACMLVVTAFAPASEDPEIREAVHAGATSVRSAFAATLKRCAARGSLATDVSATAAMLFTLLNGLSALGRTGGTRRQRNLVLDQAFAALAA